MKVKYLILFVSVILLTRINVPLIAQQLPGIKDSLYSKVLKENRKIRIILPKEYKADAATKYEMFYVLDGEWYAEHVPFIYNFTVSAGFAPPCIYVVLPNTYVNDVNLRDRDFSPTKDPNDTITGGADNFHTFIKTELIPYIEQKYPANGNRTLIGSSFSGLFSVYAFLKEPTLFRSFIASDPNLNWDEGYPAKLAAKKLPDFTAVRSTLFVAGLVDTYRDMGIAAVDSVFSGNAPVTLPWKFIAYPNETHYSVQHKAFYDGMRFSHTGYRKDKPMVHPANALLQEGMPLKLFIMNRNAEVKYTIDGSEPLMNSAELASGEFLLKGPADFRIKAFPSREEYAFNSKGSYMVGSIPAAKVKKGLRYSFYAGEWTALPDHKTLKPSQSGVVTEGFSLSKIASTPGKIVLDGGLEISEDAYYIFLVPVAEAIRLNLGGKALLDCDGRNCDGMQTYGSYLKKGMYPLHAEILRKKGSADLSFTIFRTTPSNDRWWQNEFMKY